MTLTTDFENMNREQLHFGFGVYANSLATRLAAGSKSSSFVLSISGPWGSGKTTLMDEIINRFPEEKFVIRYNAWSNSQRHEVWRTFFVSVLATLNAELDKRFPINTEQASRGGEGDGLEKLLRDSEQSLYRAFVKETPGEIQIDTGSLFKTGAKLALKFIPCGEAINSLSGFISGNSIPTTDSTSKDKSSNEFSAKDLESVMGVFKRDMAKEHIAQIESLEQFSRTVQTLVSKFASSERRLLIVIDDIDRCLPEHSLEILEAIKLFLDLPFVGYIIASDNAVVQHALDLRYKQSSSDVSCVRADHYLEKMVDLSFSLPMPSNESFETFVTSELEAASFLKPNITMLKAALGLTPRSWKRFSNRLMLKNEILSEGGLIGQSEELTSSQASVLVKAELLSYRWPHFIREINNFTQLKILESALNKVNISSSQFQSDCKKQDSIVSVLMSHTSESLGDCQYLDELLQDRALLQCLGGNRIFSGDNVESEFGEVVLSLDF